MDHNLEDSLNLESAIGVDFDHSEEAVVSQADVTLDTSGHEEGIPMEFDNIEEQPMLMDTGNEEIIDFMESQFTLQELSVDSDQMTEPTTTVDSNEQEYTSQSEGMIDLQFEPPTISVSDVLPQDVQPKVVAIKTNSPALRQIAKKESIVLTKTTTVPRQVAIAPKPPTLGNSLKVFRQKATLMTGKQVNIMPKPVNSKSVSLVKKVSLATAMQANAKGNTVLAQVGKQFIMMPAGSGQKLKLITTGGAGGAPTVRLVSASESQSSQNVSSSQTNKPAIANVIIQDGKAIVGHPAVKTSQTTAPVITKMLPTTTTSGVQARYVTMTQKTVPISLEKKLLLSSSPTKPGVRLAKKPQMIAIKSPTPKLAPTSGTQGTTTKKVVITANPQNVILRTTAPPKTGQATKGNIGQRTQLHQINVPGKGIQYIRLVTNANASSASAKVSPKPVAAPSKTFVLADSKGNLIQMTAEKMVSGQPPPLIVTGNANAAEKMTSKPQQRLVKIAPLASRTGQAAMHQQTRSGKSLLAPLSPAAEGPTTLDDVTELLQRRELTEVVDRKPQIDHIDQDEYGPGEGEGGSAGEELIDNRETDSKAALQRLIAETVGGVTPDHSMSIREVEVDFERTRSPSCDGSGRSPERNRRQDEHPLIVIPSYMKQDMNLEDDGLRRMNNDMLEVDVETYNNQYHSPQTPRALSDSEILSTDLGLRPRKACNCTKSQCLKLYCDCFANGEFCHRCNCNNCHNNIENEELRQKAIRGCLDRNPNAFRPKIGKSKTDGPEIVRRHNKGCNCKRSGCLKNYCECYEAKIACTYICKCVGCRNVEETLERARRRDHAMATMTADTLHAAADAGGKQPCSFMTTEVIEAVCQCLIAAAVDKGEGAEPQPDRDPTRDVIEEFARCLQDIISAAHHTAPASLLDEAQA